MKKNRKKKKKSDGRLVLTLFAIPFAGVGVAMLILTLHTISQSRRAADWVVTPCEVVSVKLERHRDSDSTTTYECTASYTYKVNGKVYSSDRVSFSGGADNVGSYQQDCCRAIKNGRRHHNLTCFVNPEDPTEAVIFPEVRWGMIGFYMVFVLAFGGVGFGLLIFGITGLFSNKKSKAAASKHPEKPWKWNPKWQEGTIASSDKSGLIFAILFCLFWNVIAFPIGIMAFADGYLKHGNKPAMLGLLFPAIGLVLVGWVIYAMLRYLKYGKTVLQLAEIPGVIGGKLAGVIHVPVNIVAEDGFHLHLRCIHKYTTSSGKNTTTHEKTIWESSQTLATEIMASDHSRTALPVLFGIPYNCRESTVPVGGDGIIWRLEVAAKTKGIDFKTKFDIPVFKTKESSRDFVLDDSAIREYREAPSESSLFGRTGLIFESTHSGVSYRFPAARQTGAALGMGIAALFVSIVLAVMTILGAPIILVAVFGLIDFFVILGVIDLLLVSSKVDIDHRMITVTRGIFGLGIPKMVRRKNVADVMVVSSFQSGDNKYYAIKLITDEDKKIMLGNNVFGRSDADKIAAHIKASIAG